jgi:hypothetical protein
VGELDQEPKGRVPRRDLVIIQHTSAHIWRPGYEQKELTNTTYVIFRHSEPEVSARATGMVLEQAIEKLTEPLGQVLDGVKGSFAIGITPLRATDRKKCLSLFLVILIVSSCVRQDHRER